MAACEVDERKHDTQMKKHNIIFSTKFLFFFDSSNLPLAGSPGLDVPVLPSSEDDLLVVVEAEGPSDLIAMAARQTDTICLVETPAALVRP